MRSPAAKLAVLCAGLSACTPAAFFVTLTGQTTVQGDPLGLGSLLTTIPAIGSFSTIDFDGTQDFQSHGATKDAVQSLKVSSLTIKIVSPNTQDFSFLDELSFYASAGQGETLVADKTGIAQLPLPAPNPVLVLGLHNAELRQYLSAPSISLTVRGSGRQPPNNTVLEATVKLRVLMGL